ncbi:MAG: hypothetical protein ACKVX7_14610 [Planctomycetota bacterium]
MQPPLPAHQDDSEDLPIVLLPDDDEYDDLVASVATASIVATMQELAEVRPHASPARPPAPVVERIEVGTEIDGLAQLSDEIDHEVDDELRREAQVSLRRMARVAVVLLLSMLALLFVIARPYYQLAPAAKPFHHLHDALRSSGALGLALGVGGTGLMAASLVYLIRKRYVWRGFGTVREWLNFHIVAGVLGPTLVLFHANFHPTSAVALFALIAMMIVVASGVIGRYVIVHMPHSLSGREVEIEELRRRLVVYRQKLEELGVDSELLRASGVHIHIDRPWWFPRPLGRWLDQQRGRRLAIQQLQESLRARGNSDINARRVMVLARRLYRERAWLVWYQKTRAVIASWRFLHRWLAITLLVAVAYHIVLATKYGQLWIFGGGR